MFTNRTGALALIRLPLDNNAAERQHRPIAFGRKNWLFVASEDGGTWAAVPMTVLKGCRLQLHDAIIPALIAANVDPQRLTPANYAAKRNNVA